MAIKFKRGDIFYADLNPVVGSEQGGVRPVLIIQNNTGNKYSPTTIVIAAITSKVTDKKALPTHYPIQASKGIERDSLILLEQIRTIDKTRIGEYIGTLDDEVMKGIDQALAISMGIDI